MRFLDTVYNARHEMLAAALIFYTILVAVDFTHQDKSAQFEKVMCIIIIM